MHRSRASNQCDLEHLNVNNIRRNRDLPARLSGESGPRASSMEFMAHSATRAGAARSRKAVLAAVSARPSPEKKVLKRKS
jgi:hypothetical protein